MPSASPAPCSWPESVTTMTSARWWFLSFPNSLCIFFTGIKQKWSTFSSLPLCICIRKDHCIQRATICCDPDLLGCWNPPGFSQWSSFKQASVPCNTSPRSSSVFLLPDVPSCPRRPERIPGLGPRISCFCKRAGRRCTRGMGPRGCCPVLGAAGPPLFAADSQGFTSTQDP